MSRLELLENNNNGAFMSITAPRITLESTA
jgi:hypothetical protein